MLSRPTTRGGEVEEEDLEVTEEGEGAEDLEAAAVAIREDPRLWPHMQVQEEVTAGVHANRRINLSRDMIKPTEGGEERGGRDPHPTARRMTTIAK